MVNFFNKLFCILKHFLLIVSFVLTFYIIIYMYHRLNKNLISSYDVFVPYILLFILFTINILFNQKRVNKSLFYNITSCLIFSCIIFVNYRTLFDTYMIYNLKLGYNINFPYFNNFINPMKVMLYGLIFTNILLMLNFKNKKNLTNKV